MRQAQGLIGILALMGWTGVANAQFSFPSATGFGKVSVGRTFSVTTFRHHHHFSSQRYYSFGFGYYPYSPYFDGSFYGPAIYGYSSPWMVPSSPPVINLPAPERPARRPVEEELPKGKLVIKPGQAKAKEEPKEKVDERMEKPEPPLPGVPASVFRPVRPADRERALQPVAPENLKPPGPPEPVEVRPPEPQPWLRPVEPAGDSKDLVRFGKEVFAAREYGRAERFFRQATTNETPEPLAFFLLAQARFALGKYQEAVAAIHTGMRLNPDWPQSDFQAPRLYGPRTADFQEQLDHLKAVTANNPSESTLAFLYGYQLWFAGRKEQAKAFFHQAEADAKEKDFIQRFLLSAPPEKN